MSVRKTVMAATVAGALGLPVAASAITIDGITFTLGSIFEDISLAEGERFDAAKAACDGTNTFCGNNNGIIDQVGEELVGIGRVNTIEDGASNVLWDRAGIDAPNNGKELTLYFYNYIAETIETTVGQVLIGFTGGVIEIWSEDLGVNNFTKAGSQAAGIASASSGSLFLQLVGSPIGLGPLNGVELSVEFGGLTGAPITLESTGTALGTGTVTGLGLLDIVGGSAASYFDTNTFGCVDAGNVPTSCPDDADKTFTSSGQLTTFGVGAGDGWAFDGTGEVLDFAAVPTPGPLALIGLGMAAAGFAARRKAKHVA